MILCVTFSVKIWSKEARGYKRNILLLLFQFALIDAFFRKKIIKIWEINPWNCCILLEHWNKNRKMCYEIWLKILLKLGTFMQRIYSRKIPELKLVLVLLKFMKFISDNAFIVSLAMLQVIHVVPIPCRIVQEWLLLIQYHMVYCSHYCLKCWIQFPYMFRLEVFLWECVLKYWF